MTSNPSIGHADHDLLVIAAHAAGDATGTDRARAAQLVATCQACAGLFAELQAIQAATAELPAPARTRDFRLSEQDAARLRPAGWRSILASLRSPRLAFPQPVAVGMATLGLVGLLVASLPGPLLTSTSESGASTGAALPASPGGTSEDLLKENAAAPAETTAPVDGATQPQPGEPPAAEPAPVTATDGTLGDRTLSSPGTDTADVSAADAGMRDDSPTAGVSWLTWASAFLLVAGVGLFAVGRLARRAG